LATALNRLVAFDTTIALIGCPLFTPSGYGDIDEGWKTQHIPSAELAPGVDPRRLVAQFLQGWSRRTDGGFKALSAKIGGLTQNMNVVECFLEGALSKAGMLSAKR
jgi:hypothetical protein